MKNDKNSTSVFKLLKDIINPDKPSQKKDRIKNHQPSWMYRNE